MSHKSRGFSAPMERVYQSDDVMGMGEIDFSSASNSDEFFFRKYINALKHEPIPHEIDGFSLDEFVRISSQKNSLPLNQMLANRHKGERKRQSIEHTRRLEDMARQISDKAYEIEDTKSKHKVLIKQIQALDHLFENVVDMQNVSEGGLYENNDFAIFMYEILLGSILHRIVSPERRTTADGKRPLIEYHPCSSKMAKISHPEPTEKGGKIGHYATKFSEISQDDTKALNPSSDEKLVDIMTSWLKEIRPHLIKWWSSPADSSQKKAQYFRTTLMIGIETYQYKSPKAERGRTPIKANDIEPVSHQIALCYEEKWDFASDSPEYRRFYIIDQMTDEEHYVVTIQRFIRDAFILDVFPSVFKKLKFYRHFTDDQDEDERLIHEKQLYEKITNNLDTKVYVFTCISLAIRAVLLLGFIEHPRDIIESAARGLRNLELSEFARVVKYHFVKMAQWLLTNRYIMDEFHVVTTGKNQYVHEITGGDDSAYITVHHVDKVGRGIRVPDDEFRKFYFRLDSETIEGTFIPESLKLDQEQPSQQRLKRQRQDASCVVQSQFPTFLDNDFISGTNHFVIQ